MKYSELLNKISGIYKINFPNDKAYVGRARNNRDKRRFIGSKFINTRYCKKYQCSRDTIGDINQGKRYSKDNEDYPIRKFYPHRDSKKPVSTILGSEE